MADRKPIFHQYNHIDTTPLPGSIPPVKEIGATSAPLLSAAFFINARCGAYGDDFMQCKAEANGRGELECLKEGRRVTRCARSVIRDMNTHCLDDFRRHWECLENNGHQLFQCRSPEWKLSKCVFDELGLEKVIPNQPSNITPVHLRKKVAFSAAVDSNPFIPTKKQQHEGAGTS